MSGLVEPDEGSVTVSPALSLGMLPQESETISPGVSIQEWMTERLGGTLSLEGQTALSRCGFRDIESGADILSGGWRKRLDMALLLAQCRDVLLLDEPTNHLDTEGLLWLEATLSRHRGGFVMVTHDRSMLERSCNRIVEINPAFPGGLLDVSGSYRVFRERREEVLQSLVAEQQRIRNRAHREQEWLRAGVKARTTKSQARIDQAHELQARLADLNRRVRTERSTTISFESSGHRSGEVISLVDVSLERGQRRLFSGVTLSLNAGDALGIVGPNGSGKSSLLKLLAGELPPTSGTIARGASLSLSYFDQHRAAIDPMLTLSKALAPNGDQVVFSGRAYPVAAWADRFLFTRSQLMSSVGSLSGGERARLLVARLMLSNASLLILDEPTNDLDIATLEALEEALSEYAGTIVMVSHDRFFLSEVCSGFVGLDGRGGLTAYASYEQWEEDFRHRGPGSAGAEEGVATQGGASERPIRKGLAPAERKEHQALERKIAQIEQTLAELSGQLERASATGVGNIVTLAENIHETQQQLDSLIERWGALEELRMG
jgi:ATP-binding cassette subfamily F protein uup